MDYFRQHCPLYRTFDYGDSAPTVEVGGPSIDGQLAFWSSELNFGLPGAIRTDNSKLSVWWLQLGIQIERIQPGHPQQNGRHERMHLTLKKEATKPAAANVLQQQARFDAFVDQYTVFWRPQRAT